LLLGRELEVVAYRGQRTLGAPVFGGIAAAIQIMLGQRIGLDGPGF